MDPILGEIRIFAGTFAPRGWAFCQGQLLNIAQNQALFALLGTTYGGNGTTTFALPDLRGRVALGFGQGTGLSSYVLGQQGGSENVTLSAAQMPAHNHALGVNNAAGTSTTPVNMVPAASTARDSLYAAAPNAFMAGSAISSAGANQSHENRQPFIAMNYIIALEGAFPSRN